MGGRRGYVVGGRRGYVMLDKAKFKLTQPCEVELELGNNTLYWNNNQEFNIFHIIYYLVRL
jgi:hypothetical protein